MQYIILLAGDRPGEIEKKQGLIGRCTKKETDLIDHTYRIQKPLILSIFTYTLSAKARQDSLTLTSSVYCTVKSVRSNSNEKLRELRDKKKGAAVCNYQ